MTRPQSKLPAALPFWISLLGLPSVAAGAFWGGWALLITPLFGIVFSSLADYFIGLNADNADTQTEDADLFWYRLITLIWFPLQFVMVFGLIWVVTRSQSLAGWEKVAAFYNVGILTGAVGINYAHELMHQSSKLERWLGDLLMNSVLYGHFRSEHLLVHHLYIGTPRDPVTARYNENFWRFLPRVLISCFASAWKAETRMLARKSLPSSHISNPFWRYGALQLGFLLLATLVGGWVGLALFLVQATIAVLYLEVVNYVEHYGLTRLHLGDGKYEHTKPHHSWNAAHTVTNWMLINLQRHSDHHYKPSRRFPLLQTYDADAAPQLPLGYPLMAAMAMIPPVWRRRMNPRVRAWRKHFYPEIEDWGPYNRGENPMPRGS